MSWNADRSLSRADRLQDAQAFIDSHLELRHLSPASTARALGISVRLLHLLFKPTGTTFARYVLARRLERARQELAESGRKVLDVAYGWGIEHSVFYRAFRKAYGTTPAEYRRSMRKQQPRKDDLACGAHHAPLPCGATR